MGVLMGLVPDDIYATLKGCFNSDGSVMEGMHDLAASKIEDMKSLTGIDISMSEEGQIQMNGADYTSLSQFDTDFTEAAAKTTIGNFFDDRQYYSGVINDTYDSLKTFCLAVGAATGCELYPKGTQSEDEFYAGGDRLLIRAQRATANSRAQVTVGVPTESMVAIFAQYVDIFKDEGGSNIRYFIFKGRSGDCYVKGERTAESTAVPIDEAEEHFADVSFASFVGTDVGSGVWSISCEHPTSGFAIVQMENKLPEDPKNVDTRYDILLLEEHGCPLTIVTERGLTEKDAVAPTFNITWTGGGTDYIQAAPIYTPDSEPYASNTSRYALVTSQSGYQFVSLGLGLQYVYDSGFLMEA